MTQPTRTCASCGEGLTVAGTLVSYAGKMWCAACRPDLHPHPAPPDDSPAGETDPQTPSLDN